VSAAFRIAIVGRTNVGKSTLFNRLSRSRNALVFDRHGVTRDVREESFEIDEKSALLIDSPGLFDSSELSDVLSLKLEKLIDSADLFLFMIDGSVGVTVQDKDAADLLRRTGKSVIVAVNKCESRKSKEAYLEAMELGFDDVLLISSEHGLGISALHDTISSYIKSDSKCCKCDDSVVKIAIVGRPNVGKSTFVNTTLGDDRQLVADFAGLTRESSKFSFELDGRKLAIVDTPGIRRAVKISDVLEKISTSIARESYRNADVVILIIDATSVTDGQIEKQDLNLASKVIGDRKALVIALNKCDRIKSEKNQIATSIRCSFSKSFSQFKSVPFVMISAMNHDDVLRAIRLSVESYEKHRIKIKTSDLSDWLSDLNRTSIMQGLSTKFKLKYACQTATLPPTFVIFAKNKQNIRKNQERFIINSLRQRFKLNEIVIDVFIRDRTA
jgi:GTP-binding protein